MRSLGTFGAVLAMGLSLAACTRQDAADLAGGRIGRATESAGAAQGIAPVAAPSAGARAARFASLPDRGELLHYAAQAPVRDGAYTWHRTALSEQHALDAIKGGMLRVPTPNGGMLGFQYDRSIRHDSGDWTWIGHMPGKEGVQAILTFGAGAVFGSIGQPDTRPLRLTTRGGASWLVETDPTQLAGLASHAANPVSPDFRIISPAAMERLRAGRHAAGGVKSSGLAPKAVPAAAAAAQTVDLLIGYTQGFATAQGGAGNAVTRLNSMVDTANVGLQNSKVSGQIRLVHAMQVNYTDNNSNDTALGQLTGYDSEDQEETTPNAAFNALRQAREQYGADLVSLVRPFKSPEHDSCGVAWLVGGGKQGDSVGPSNGWDFFGYSVVSDGTDRDEDDGKTYYCEEHTLAHELGHNMGSNHDRENSKGDDGKLDDPDDYGAFAYSFGYKPTSIGRSFYTIMAYGDSGQTSYLTFSNPRTTFCGGNACGVNNSEDNAKSLGLIMPSVSGFRSTVVAQAGEAAQYSGDYNGDGRSDILWRNLATGGDSIWRSGKKAGYQPVEAVTDLQWQIAGVGDFIGDGKSDILWRNRATGENMIWKSASKAGQQDIDSVGDPQWQVAGVGDFNGDGRSDILWRNLATGANSIWRSASKAGYMGVSSVTDLHWQVAGVGDFNGDGKSDILWRNLATGANSIWMSAKKNSYRAVESVSATQWQVAGVGDFNGDGKSDILWRSQTSGSNMIWKSANAADQQGIQTVADLHWQVAGVGDFNGDDKSDILWRDLSTGANSMWMTANKSNYQAVERVADLNWVVEP
jgi:hypothetical protein